MFCTALSKAANLAKGHIWLKSLASEQSVRQLNDVKADVNQFTIKVKISI